MKSIFIVAGKQSVTHGHGNYGEVYSLLTYNDEKLYPAFISKKDAQLFIDKVKNTKLKYAGYNPEIILEIPIHN